MDGSDDGYRCCSGGLSQLAYPAENQQLAGALDVAGRKVCTPMKSIVLFNPRSGSVPADARDKLTAALRQGGIKGADLIETDPENCDKQLRELADMARTFSLSGAAMARSARPCRSLGQSRRIC